MTKLILIRHGQTNWNLKKRYCGFSDLGLNKQGKNQAKKLYKKFKIELTLPNNSIHKFYSSDRKRALQSARIIFKGRKIQKISDLREINFGILEGLTFKKALKTYPHLYKKWLKNPFDINIPQGESFMGFKKRVVKAFNKIIKLNKNKTAAIVCHAGTISVFINHILKTNAFWKYIPSSASVNIIECKNGKTSIKLFNDVSG